MTSGENAQPHHCGQQQPGDILCVRVRRYAAITLACDHASPEKGLQLAYPRRHDVGNARIMRRHLERRVDQKATKAALKRAFNDLGQKGFDRLARRQCLFDAGNAGTHIGIQVAVEALREERPFVAESVVNARWTKPHGASEIAHGSGGIAGCPEALHRSLNGDAIIELTRSGQYQSIRFPTY
jgi:hypothetical protein